MLLDENIRSSYAEHLIGHEVSHIDDLGIKGITNGALLAYASSNFDAFLTLDRGILHQQRHDGDLRILVVRVPNSTLASLVSRVTDVLKWLEASKPGDRAEV